MLKKKNDAESLNPLVLLKQEVIVSITVGRQAQSQQRWRREKWHKPELSHVPDSEGCDLLQHKWGETSNSRA